MRGFISRVNRPMFVNLLAEEWFPGVPGLVERLQADPPAVVADVGCGTGWSSIAIARGFPRVTVVGLDLDERFQWGWSALHCLPCAMTTEPAAGTGTIMRTPLLREYALAAGFADLEVLPIENDFWRFYRLTE